MWKEFKNFDKFKKCKLNWLINIDKNCEKAMNGKIKSYLKLQKQSSQSSAPAHFLSDIMMSAHYPLHFHPQIHIHYNTLSLIKVLVLVSILVWLLVLIYKILIGSIKARIIGSVKFSITVSIKANIIGSIIDSFIYLVFFPYIIRKYAFYISYTHTKILNFPFQRDLGRTASWLKAKQQWHKNREAFEKLEILTYN